MSRYAATPRYASLALAIAAGAALPAPAVLAQSAQPSSAQAPAVSDSGDTTTCPVASIDRIAKTLMSDYEIPGMSVGISHQGQRCVRHYGVAALGKDGAVDDATLFEIGSVSKTLTAALAAYAQETGHLKWQDRVADHQAELADTPIGDATLLELGTYSAGGLPLQFPSDVNDATLLDYYRQWQPDFASGTQRLYSNPSIGLLGDLAARSLARSSDRPFAKVMSDTLLPRWQMSHTYLEVPPSEAEHYAFGVSPDNPRTRVTPGPMDAQAYGIKTTAQDMLTFIEANMASYQGDTMMDRALLSTHQGYAAVGPMHQGLGWESYAYPATLETLLAGNSSDMALKPQSLVWLTPEASPSPDRWINKTGSTFGFGAYAAFVPAERLGIVILANKRYPNAERVEAAYRISEAMSAP